jgi:DNA-binding Lrp family transcriptional regulator
VPRAVRTAAFTAESRLEAFARDHGTVDDLDRELLNAVQWDFPLEPRPFAALGERLGIAEPEVRDRIVKVKDEGVLRQLSAIFDTRALGYTSALVAAKIDPDHIDEAADIVSEHPGVSHNYKRNHEYNLWYTIAVPPSASLDAHIEVLHRDSGARVTRKLPTLKLYKIGVKLDMTGKSAANAKTEVLEHERPERKAEMPAPDLSDLELATIRVVQHDLPTVERPFAAYATLIADSLQSPVDEADVLATLQRFKERKLMRRFAAVMNHRSAGFKANAMGVWAVPDDQLDAIGPQMAEFSAVSHCYRRPTYEDWPYSVFTMVHGRTARDCEATIEAIRTETGIDEYCLLWSVKEYKKVRLEYFTSDWDAWADKHALTT